MKPFLRWFRQYREIEQGLEVVRQRLEEELRRSLQLQDQMAKLQDQNLKLEEGIREAKAEQITSVKSVANVFAYMSGNLPPYAEAYQIPRRSEPVELGAVGAGRIFPRDIVQRSRREFHEQIQTAAAGGSDES